MKLENMKKGILYIVTKKSVDETLQIGDQIYIDRDGSLCSITIQGWIGIEDIESVCHGMECELDKEWAKDKFKQLQDEINYLNEYLEN